ncbi:hypothetical protein Q8F55_000687 [Vanrija albida]|uniref:RING-type domain-containing protein n=1 Tax=Vanrija albida TaxID=181172 RepID=A0ABR3QEW3_9TREE
MAAIALSQWYSNSSGGPVARQRSRSTSVLVPAGRMSVYYPTVQQTVVVDAGLPAGTAEAKDDSKTRRRETIFGPDVGDDDQPGWTTPEEGNKVSVDVVKRWVDRAKSEEGLHATTTLQALVNLKRPTLLLQQLPVPQTRDQSADITPVGPTPPLHLLKFNYDAMTPKVNITLSVHQPLPTPASSSSEHLAPEPPRVIYTGIHPGGFNQTFQLPATAALDLTSAIAPTPPAAPGTPDGDDKSVKTPGEGEGNTPSEEMSRSSADRAHQHSSTTPDLAAIPEFPSTSAEAAAAAEREERPPRRFGIFPRRSRRPADVESGDIELANATATAPATPAEDIQEKPEEPKPEEPEYGLRLLIRIEAAGPEGQTLRRRNAQLTHILISGMWVPDAGSTPQEGPGKRVWVIKVVRREALIGSHSFLLKEIYGLSSTSTSSEPASYPPTAADPYASTPNECIVCLTSPRDVVLLPCRHLVVCRDCAVGMVEFGAGGRVARREEPAADAAAGPAGNGAAAETTVIDGGAAAAPAPAPAPAPRRKKKAKGWYCPVCRQPYTSLLRLALPASKAPATPDDDGTVPLARAPSIASVRTTRSVRSVAPTLPPGAEEMLARLPPGAEEHGHDHDHDHDDDEEEDAVPEAERPQFVEQAPKNEVDAAERGEAPVDAAVAATEALTISPQAPAAAPPAEADVTDAAAAPAPKQA